ncbi:hypothetical protein ALT721_1360017 [Alteromonas alvinellae]
MAFGMFIASSLSGAKEYAREECTKGMSASVTVGELVHPVAPTISANGNKKRLNCLNISFHIHIAIWR